MKHTWRWAALNAAVALTGVWYGLAKPSPVNVWAALLPAFTCGFLVLAALEERWDES